jgi:hypothetical protein
MEVGQFLVPDDDEFIEAFGVAPEAIDSSGTSKMLSLDTGAGDGIHFTFDAPGRSVALKWYRQRACMITLFREEASRLSVYDGPGGTGLAVEFASGSLSGQLRIEIWPAVSVDDRLLAVLT